MYSLPLKKYIFCVVPLHSASDRLLVQEAGNPGQLPAIGFG
jgi:hypothetical protein